MYVVRNPIDAAISYYHFNLHLYSIEASKSEFIDAFVNNKVPFTPMNSHVLEFWKIRDEPNILFLFYEDMKRDLKSVVKKTAEFFGKSFTQQQIDELCNHLSFENMKTNTTVNKEKELSLWSKSDGNFSFLRKGRVGSFKEELTAEENQKLDEYLNFPDFEKFGFAYKFS